MVEDNLDLAETVKGFLSSEVRLALWGEANHEDRFKELISQHLPDLALIDISISHSRSGLELLEWIRNEHPIVKPVIMTVSEENVLEAYELGARGYVLKSQLEILTPTLLDVHNGKLIIPPDVGALFVKQVAEATERWKKSVELEKISDREREILNLLQEGTSRKEIGKRLNISFFTVRRHIQNILVKTGKNSVRDVLTKFNSALLRTERRPESSH